ncbi:rho guanine nucleotide exchange factor 2 isoform X2 [Takifugu rubripes]|uniref:rho guanine nucleotide exchange factor 2 isoform X2 n=1 Tax=Takifugu rubripes TaxID=31033 RepID=UPI0005D13FD6|nr:rho guanine nucleotide exchange factor 2 isoform X2 [Takifugu rubripes]|eukprot:XP_011607651.1 PREDICTED: rho guanine nucleotide exchange factor 2 isoform X2 [Takifugu rubripes]
MSTITRVTNLSKLRQERMREINLRNKERERLREQENALREREARYSNGHLFTSLTVSGTTLCSACNKSITAKEALSCSTCNVTIHNRCRDTLPNCAKMKQRQQKTALMRNRSALQNTMLHTKRINKRPSSAIYPSDSFRQPLLGSRLGRSSLLLSKSVSTNNIGTLNDDSPLGLRRILSQSTDSLSFRARAMSIESLADEGDQYYSSVLEEIEFEGKDFKADSWSMAVDSGYLQTHRKDVIKRQDVIYELIQTEVHHVQTLHIMERVLRQGMLDELQLNPSIVHGLFPCLNQLIRIHSHFLDQLFLRRDSSLQPGSGHNFTIHQLGDVLLEQFSGQNADDMRKTYAEFCSRHLKVVKLYKELLTRDKKFQSFIRRVSRGPLLRCHGFQECILLVTQRISKYPVLIQSILDNTTGDDEEVSCLVKAFSMVKELLSSVDQQMEDLEKTQRLKEILSKLDPRAETRVREGGLFKSAELLRRKLLHDGNLLWKTPGSRHKDVQVLLMTDVLVFLQEKDQRYIFSCLDKPAVLSLQNLIVRDIANQERGMFLIIDSSPPVMYEFHATTKEKKNVWMRHIQHAVSRCPSREEFPLIETEHKAFLRRLRADLHQKNQEVLELLQERVTLFCELAEVTSGQEGLQPPITRSLFRADVPHAPRAGKLLLDATAEVDRLSELLLGSAPFQTNYNHMDAESRYEHLYMNGSQDFIGAKEISQSLMNLSVYLHALQAAVIKQDSILELLQQEQEPAAGLCHSLGQVGANRETRAGSSTGELVLLQRQHSLLQEELLRLRDAENRFKDSEKARAKLEREVRHMRTCCRERTVQEPTHQPDAPQENSDLEVDMTSEDEDGTASES